MRASVSVLAGALVLLLAGAAQAMSVTAPEGIVVDPSTSTSVVGRMVTVDFMGLPEVDPHYMQIDLLGATGLCWDVLCPGGSSENPRSLGASFVAQFEELEMQYQSSVHPTDNFIEYHFDDDYTWGGAFESVAWVEITLSDGSQHMVTADRPILTLVPEPSTGLLCFAGLTALSLVRRRLDGTRTRMGCS